MSTLFEQKTKKQKKTKLILDYFYVESEFPALHLTEFVMRTNVKTKTAKNVEMFQYIDVNDTGGGYNNQITTTTTQTILHTNVYRFFKLLLCVKKCDELKKKRNTFFFASFSLSHFTSFVAFNALFF